MQARRPTLSRELCSEFAAVAATDPFLHQSSPPWDLQPNMEFDIFRSVFAPGARLGSPMVEFLSVISVLELDMEHTQYFAKR